MNVRVDRTERHLFVVGRNDAPSPPDAGGAINLFGGNIEYYQSLGDASDIRRDDHSSDDDGK